MNRETIRKELSAILTDTSEENQLKCNIQIGEKEAVGISTLELPTIISIFQQPEEGIIWFEIEGYENYLEFDEIPKYDLINVLKFLR